MGGVNIDLGGLFLVLTFLLSGGDAAQTPSFDYAAILQEHKVAIEVEDLMAVLALPDEKKIAPIIEQLGDPSFDVREAAAKTLGEMGPKVLPILRKRGLESADLEIRVRTRTIIAKILEEKDGFVPLYHAALAALGKLKATKAVSLVGEFLDEPDSEIRRAAVQTLSEIGNKAAREQIVSRLREAAKSNNPSTSQVLDLLEGYAATTKEGGLDEAVALIGRGARTVDVRVMEILANGESLAPWAEAVCNYVVLRIKAGIAPPEFICKFLAEAYGQTPNEEFDWYEFCKRGQKRLKARGNLDEMRKSFLAGLEAEKLLADYEDCLSFVPAGTMIVGGIDLRKMRNIPLGKDFEEYARKDAPISTAVKMMVERCGAFRSDVVVFFVTVDISSGKGHTGFIAKGGFDSKKQTAEYAKMLDLKKANHEGMDFLKQKEAGYADVSICFLDDKYIILDTSFMGVTSMENILDCRLGKDAGISSERDMMKLLDRETAGAPLWGMGRLDKFIETANIEEKFDEASPVKQLLQLKDFVARVNFTEKGVSINVRARCKTEKGADSLEALVKVGIEQAKEALNREIKMVERQAWMPEEGVEFMKMIRRALDTVKVDADGVKLSGEGEIVPEAFIKLASEAGFPELSRAVLDALEGELPEETYLPMDLECTKAELVILKKKEEGINEKIGKLNEEKTALEAQPDSDEKTARLEEIGYSLERQNDRLENAKYYTESAESRIKEIEQKLSGKAPPEKKEEEGEEELPPPPLPPPPRFAAAKRSDINYFTFGDEKAGFILWRASGTVPILRAGRPCGHGGQTPSVASLLLGV